MDRITGAKGYKPAPGELHYTVYDRPATKPLPPIPADY